MNKKGNLILLVTAFGLLGSSFLSSCGEKEETNETTFYDYVHNDTNIRLKIDYEGKNFYKDGIAKMSTDYESGDLFFIDGDTTHFTQVDYPSEDRVKSRYYGIDTPESTGDVEPYGKKASNFTKEKLKAAKTIVVTSTNISSYEAPQVDSTGSRYLSLVWISEVENAPYNELYLLNLWIVQEGLSQVKAVDKFPEFSDTFYAAQQQAKDFKLNLYSGEDDPDYNYGDYQDVSVFALMEEVKKNIEDSTYENKYENAKVRIQGTVAGYANNILYLQSTLYDEDSGETKYSGINIFCGMTSISARYTTVNTYIQLCGLAQTSENYGFQLTSVYSFPKGSATDENDTQVIYTASQIPEEYKIHEFEDTFTNFEKGNLDYLNSPVKVSDEIIAYGGYDSSSSDVTLYVSEDGNYSSFSTYIPFLYKPDPDNDPTRYWSSYEDYKNHRFKLQGIYNYRTSSSKYQIVLRDSSDLVCIDYVGIKASAAQVNESESLTLNAYTLGKDDDTYTWSLDDSSLGTLEISDDLRSATFKASDSITLTSDKDYEIVKITAVSKTYGTSFQKGLKVKKVSE